jgi:hypothetical protein
MQCLACGAEMILEQVAGDDTMPVPGFAHHTFMCSVCGDTERRLLFTGDVGSSRTDPVPLHAAPPISPSSAVENGGAPAPGVMRRVIAKFRGVCQAVEHRLLFRHSSASCSTAWVPATPHTSAPPLEPVSVPRAPPTSLRPAEPVSVPTVPSTSVSPEIDSDLDECEALLRHAIEIVQGPTRSSQTKTNLIEVSSAPLAQVVSSMRAERSPTSRIVVQIHYDPQKAKFVAKDTKSGLSVLRHQDSARLRAMCDRMGWQVVDGAVTSAGD